MNRPREREEGRSARCAYRGLSLRFVPLAAVAALAALAIALSIFAARPPGQTRPTFATSGEVAPGQARSEADRDPGSSYAEPAPADGAVAVGPLVTGAGAGSITLRPIRPAEAAVSGGTSDATPALQRYILAVRRIRERFESVLDQARMLQADGIAGLASRDRLALVARLLPEVARRAAEDLAALESPPEARAHVRSLSDTLRAYASASALSQPYRSRSPEEEYDPGTSGQRTTLMLALQRYFATPDDPRAPAA